MKRLIPVLLLTTLLLCLCASAQAHTHDYYYESLGDGTHAYRCSTCDYISYTNRCIRFCDETACVCGYTGNNMYISHRGYAYVDLGDGTCVQRCSGCGSERFAGAHSRYCNETACTYCGAEDPNMSVSHPYNELSTVDNHDGTHSNICGLCGMADSTSRHYGYCTDAVCSACGSADFDGPVNGWHSSIYVDNGDGTHSYKCEDCGTVSFSDTHSRYCYEESCCCGSTAPDMEIRHTRADYYADLHDGTHCRVCNDCGKPVSPPAEHMRNCSETTCAYCGSTDATDNIYHYWMDGAYRDQGNGTHAQFCVNCDAVEYKNHYAFCPDTACHNCGATENVIIQHNTRARDNGDGTCSEVCRGCGAVSGTRPHAAYCNRPDECGRCYANNLTNVNLYHVDAVKYIDHGNGTHTEICLTCGVPFETQKHRFDCNNPDAKCACGAALADYPGSNLMHSYTIVDLGNGYHQLACEQCDYAATPERHLVRCNSSLMKCYTCNAAITGAYEISHMDHAVDNGDGTHSYVCQDCGTITDTSSHYVSCSAEAKEICFTCGAHGDIPYHHAMLDTGVCAECGYSTAPSMLPRRTKTIAAEAFISTSMTCIQINSSCTAIGSRAFANSALRYITIPATVTKIADDAFTGCKNLTINAPAGSVAADFAASHNIKLHH